MNVPFIDLKTQYESIQDEVDHAIQQVVRSCDFNGGPYVAKFEKAFAAFCNCEFAVGVSSGTEALWLTLLAMGVGPGDAVITVPNTFIATAEAISFLGAQPLFVDVDEQTGNMDPAKLKTFLEFHCQRAQVSDAMVDLSTGRRIKAVIPVHLHGLMADMDPIMAIAEAYGLKVVEDASQAHGAVYKGRVAGSIGHAGCFCFCPEKNLGACGDAGAVVTNDEALANAVEVLRDHGQTRKNIHSSVGWNSSMDSIQGAILSVKLGYIEGWNAARQMVAEHYDRNFTELENMACPVTPPDTRHVYHTYTVRVPDREIFMNDLQSEGIATVIHYPVPIHLQEAYQFLPHQEGGYPIAETWASEVVSLPMFPELHFRQVARVIDAVRSSRANAGKIYFECEQSAF